MSRPATISDFIGTWPFRGHIVSVWVDSAIPKRRRFAMKHLSTFVRWWSENGEGRNETIYHTGLPMAVRIENGQDTASAIP